jgi:DNA-binding transcriptional regulator YiaG
MTFATDFRALRLARGLTQVETARLLDVTSHTVANWESGRSEPWQHDDVFTQFSTARTRVRRPMGRRLIDVI